MGAWAHGRMGTWAHERMGTWTHGHGHGLEHRHRHGHGHGAWTHGHVGRVGAQPQRRSIRPLMPNTGSHQPPIRLSAYPPIRQTHPNAGSQQASAARANKGC
eukprot:1601911-Prymnesium_polylepis.1